jgi:hypothetical protein
MFVSEWYSYFNHIVTFEVYSNTIHYTKHLFFNPKKLQLNELVNLNFVLNNDGTLQKNVIEANRSS